MTTSEHRKAIPLKVKLQVLINQARCAVCAERLGELENVEFDHRPPLVAREFDPVAGDYIPPQNDPNYMQAAHSDCHLYLTTGRKGDKKITSRGSDIGEAARVKRLEREHEDFRQRVLKKEPGPAPAKEQSRWPKRKLQSRNCFRTTGRPPRG